MSSPFSIRRTTSAEFSKANRLGLQTQADYTSNEIYVGRRSNWRSEMNLHRIILAGGEFRPPQQHHLSHDDVDYSDCKSVCSNHDSTASFFLEEAEASRTAPDVKRWTVGKISLIMLVLFSLTDLLLNLVDAQMDSLVAPDHYDALSADVIRPAFKYHTSDNQQQQQQHRSSKPRMGLGSAAISSVTTTLSPILPFTGGIDLRREDYWVNGLFGSFSSVLEQVRDAFHPSSSDASADSVNTIPRGGSAVSSRAQSYPHSNNKSKRKTHSQHVMAMGASDPFIPLHEIADLTLQDVSTAFRYAMENSRTDFSLNKFVSGLAPRVRKVLEQMSLAAQRSRGKAAELPITGLHPEVLAGDIDALHFCAAMRIFAEWRMLRQVPEGYKGYAVGMSLGQKDIIQNVAKIESAVHAFIDLEEDRLVDVVKSPTLRELLQYEVENGLQDVSKLPRLKEKSAAMGLLWVRRQLHYQTAIFRNVLKVAETGASAQKAVTDAYSEVYDRYHGWAVQKIFSYSFQAAPDATEIYKVMNPHLLKEIQSKHGVGGSQRLGNDDANPFEKLGRHIAGEWDKFAGSVVRIFGGDHSESDPASEQSLAIDSDDTALQQQQGLEMEGFINKEMERDAHEQILTYLTVAQPLLNDLAGLFQEFNMDDPTKV